MTTHRDHRDAYIRLPFLVLPFGRPICHHSNWIDGYFHNSYGNKRKNLIVISRVAMDISADVAIISRADLDGCGHVCTRMGQRNEWT